MNTTTAGPQVLPSVAASTRGDFVVAWWDPIPRVNRAQLFKNSSAVGSEFVVTTSSFSPPSVAMDAGGNFVSVAGVGSGVIAAQSFDSSGAPIGSEFQVNANYLGGKGNPVVAMSGGGDFVVIWEGNGVIHGDIQGQLFDAAGMKVGTEFAVNSYTTDLQWRPSVAMDDDRNFVVAWTSYYGSTGNDTSGPSVNAQLFDSAGLKVGSEFQVNTYTTSTQNYPDVAMSEDGFVVVWQSAAGGIRGQRHASDGSAIGGEFQAGFSIQAAVAMNSDGDFMVTWDGVGAQLFSSSGARVGSELQLNTLTTVATIRSAVAAGSGEFLAVWQSRGSNGTDTSDYSIQLRPPERLFSNGFENGSFNVWSVICPDDGAADCDDSDL